MNQQGMNKAWTLLTKSKGGQMKWHIENFAQVEEVKMADKFDKAQG